jgi:hypothetical protein
MEAPDDPAGVLQWRFHLGPWPAILGKAKKEVSIGGGQQSLADMPDSPHTFRPSIFPRRGD